MNLKAIKSRVAKAFSLIELMVVIAIVALLTAIAVPSYQSYLQQSKVTEIFSLASDQMNQWAQKYNQGATTAYVGSTNALGTYITATQFTFNGATTTTYASGTFTSTNCPAAGLGSPATGLGAVCIAANLSAIDSTLSNPVVIVFTPRASTASGDTSDVSLTWNCGWKSGTSGNDTNAQTLLNPGGCTPL